MTNPGNLKTVDADTDRDCRKDQLDHNDVVIDKDKGSRVFESGHRDADCHVRRRQDIMMQQRRGSIRSCSYPMDPLSLNLNLTPSSSDVAATFHASYTVPYTYQTQFDSRRVAGCSVQGQIGIDAMRHTPESESMHQQCVKRSAAFRLMAG